MCNVTPALLFLRFQSQAEKVSKSLEQQLQEMNVRADDASRNIQDMSSTKSRLEAENADLARNLQEVEMQVNSLSKQRASLQKALDDVKSQADEEARVRGKLQGDNRCVHL